MPLNRLEDWSFQYVVSLAGTHAVRSWGESYVDGYRKRVPILYWPTSLFVPLETLLKSEAIPNPVA